MGPAGICGAELDWSMDLTGGAVNGRVRKPSLRAMKTLQNLSQVQKQYSSNLWFFVTDPRIMYSIMQKINFC